MGIILRLIFTFSVRKYPFYVTVGRSRSAKKKRTASGRLSRCGRRCYCLHTAEHKTAVKVVIIDEQITCKGFIIEVILHEIGCAVQHSALIDNELGKIFLAVPLALIGFTEIVENRNIITAAAEGCHIDLKGFALIIIKIGKLLDNVKLTLRHKALGVELTGKVREVLRHKFGRNLITMQETAHRQKLIVIGKGGKVKPCATE